MTLKFESKLVENITNFRRLESETLPHTHDKASLLFYLRQRAETNAKIMAENNIIIDQELRPVLANIGDAKTADSLFTLAQRLYTYNTNLDDGLALEIHKGIITWARTNGDIDRLVRNLYCAGYIYQQILSLMVARKNYGFFYEEALDAFKEAASYKSQYADIDSRETRMYINRCLGNVYVVLTSLRGRDAENTMHLFFDAVDSAIGFWSDEAITSFDSDFPWAAFISNAHQNVCGWEQILRGQPRHEQNPEIVRRVCESFAFLDANRNAVNINKFWSTSRTENSRRFNKYFQGKISHQELIEELRAAASAAKDDDYSSKGIYESFFVSFLLINQLELSDKADEKSTRDEIGTILASVIRYFRNVPSGVSRNDITFNSALASCAKYTGKLLDVNEYIDLLLKFTSYSHLPTYVHTIKVRDLTEILTKYFLSNSPQLFIGICGAVDAEDVIKHQDEILKMTCTAALCHDIGKVVYLDTISLHSRKLYDFEFDIIKKHARMDILMQANNETMACIADVITGHHKWFDGSHGYEAGFNNIKSNYRFIIDMVAVSDSIDAATDTIGRSYAQSISLEQVIKEIQDGANTRYSPIIAKALSNEHLASQIRQCIGQGREDAYYEAYLDIIRQKEQDKEETV